MMKRISPYKGNEPYVFVSYSHRDGVRVYPIIKQMQDDGFRVWYDDGVDPGTEWDENIADHINRCGFFISFISENYLASKNCRDELSYCRSLDKNQILIYLEKVELPSGLKMRLNRLQAVYWFRYEDKMRACETLYSAENLSVCRTKAVQTEEAAAQEKDEVRPAPVPEAETDAKKGSPRGGARRIVLIALAGALVIACVILAVLPGRGNARSAQPETAAETGRAAETAAPAQALPETTPETAPEAQPDEKAGTRHVVLKADEKMTVREFTEAVEILKGRLEIFSGDSPYQMDLDGDSVDLVLPADRFADNGAEYTLRCYLSRATELFAVSGRSASQESGGAGKYSYFPVAREDLKQVSLQYGAVSGADPETLAAKGVEGDSYYYVALELTDDCVRRLAEADVDLEGGVSFAQDVDASPWYSFCTVPGGDGRTFYLIDFDQAPYFSELVVYNLTHDPLAYNFQYTLDLNEITDWERVEDPDVKAGRNQCDAADLKGQTVTFTLISYSDDYTAGAWQDLHAALKERMDVLEIPYAFSLRISEGSTIATVRCPLEHMGLPIIRTLGKRVFSVRAGLTERSVYHAELLRRPTGDGAYELVLKCDKSDLGSIAQITRAALDNGDGVVFLMLDETPFLQGRVDSVVEDGTLVFDRLCDNGEEALTADMDWLLAYLETASSSRLLQKSLALDTIQFNRDEEGRQPGVRDFELVRLGDLQALEQIRAAYPDGKIRWNYGGDIYLQMNLEIDDRLPGRSAELAEAVYHAFDFAASSFETLTLYLVNEDDSAMERARIFFRKVYNSYDGDEAGFIASYGIFFGGRLEPFKDQMRETVEQSPFFASFQKTEDEYGFYSWRWSLG